MKLTCNPEELLKAVSIAYKIIPSHPIHPVYALIMVTARNGYLHLEAFNGQTTVRWAVNGAKIETEGEAAVNGKMLQTYCTRLKDDEELVISKEAQEKEEETTFLFLKGQSGKEAKLAVTDLEATMTLKDVDEEEAIGFSIESEFLEEGISRTKYATATDETKQILCGVCLNFDIDDSDTVELAATDGHRLAIVQINYDPDETKEDIINKEPQIVLPNEAINVLTYSMKQIEGVDDVAEMVEFSVDEHIIQCNLSEGMIKTRKLDGKYPDYSQLINRDTDSYETTVTLSRKELVEGLGFISSFAVDKNRLCYLTIDPIHDFCTVQAEDNQLGSAKANESAEVKGTRGVMGFNTKYFTECL